MKTDCLPDERRVQVFDLADFLPLPENRAAFQAIEDVADAVAAREPALPLLLHGAPGTGKTHLVSGLMNQVGPEVSTRLVSALDVSFNPDTPDYPEWDCDLLVVEDLQYLPARSATLMTELWDRRLSEGAALVCTSVSAPQDLEVSARLSARLAGGLVIGLNSFGASSRRRLLEAKAAARPLAAPAEVLDWLAERLTGNGRVLEGAVQQLEMLHRADGRLDLPAVIEFWDNQQSESSVSLEQIARRVGAHFRLDCRQLLSRRRDRRALLPRQVGMYVARQAGRSLAEIGRFFGGRDHSTVLHACRKIEATQADDLVLASTIRQLAADLT